MQNKKAITYVRVSSKEQEKGGSISAQISLLDKYAQRHNLQIVKEFKESETAKKAGRTEFNKMLKYVEDNKINIILVEKTDRLYRNFHDYIKIDFKDSDLEIHLVKENEILSKDSKSHEKLMHEIKIVMANNYVNNLSEEVKKGHSVKVDKGLFPGKAPQGYRNKLEDNTIVIEETVAPFIIKAFKMANTGNYSFAKISIELYKMGIRGPRSGKKLSKSQVSRILSNPFYYGKFQWKGDLYSGSHKALITKELFDSVQSKLGFVSKPGATKHDFIYRGRIRCASCGCQVTAEIKKKKYIYYHCTNGKGDCGNVKYVREEEVEKQYIEALQKIRLTEDIIEYTRKALLDSHADEKAFRELQVTKLTRRYNELERQISKGTKYLISEFGEGIELGYVKKEIANYKLEQEDITNQINALRVANTEYIVEGMKLMKIANSAPKLFPLMNKEEKREIISLVLSNSSIKDATLQYSYKKPFNLFVNIEELRKWRERRDSNPRPSA